MVQCAVPRHLPTLFGFFAFLKLSLLLNCGERSFSGRCTSTGLGNVIPGKDGHLIRHREPEAPQGSTDGCQGTHQLSAVIRNIL